MTGAGSRKSPLVRRLRQRILKNDAEAKEIFQACWFPEIPAGAEARGVSPVPLRVRRA